MKYILILIISIVTFACNKEIQTGPTIEFTNSIQWNDSIPEDSTFTIDFKANGVDSKIQAISILIDDILVYDTSFTAIDSLQFQWNINLFNQTGEHIITIETEDENSLRSSDSKSVYIKKLTPPTFIYLEQFNSKDTTISLHSSLEFDFICKKGDRPLDSLYILSNNTILATYPNSINPLFQDSLQEIHFLFIADTIAESTIQLKLIDTGKKFTIVTKNITVVP